MIRSGAIEPPELAPIDKLPSVRSPMSINGECSMADNSELNAEFARLSDEWKSQARFFSSPTAMADLPSYQQIIGMGQDAVPLILADLRQGPDHWFIALGRITGASPVPREAYGNMDRMTEAWLQWGREHGIPS